MNSFHQGLQLTANPCSPSFTARAHYYRAVDLEPAPTLPIYGACVCPMLRRLLEILTSFSLTLPLLKTLVYHILAALPETFYFWSLIAKGALVAEGVLHSRDDVLRQQGGGQQQQYHEATLD